MTTAMTQLIGEALEPYDIRFIRLELLQTEASYQRLVRPARVQTIAAHFDSIAAGVLVVNERYPGEYYVVDGNHRLAAMRKLGHTTALCSIYRALTVRQEAEKFCICNTQRATPKAQDVFRAQLLAGSPSALQIEAIVTEYGWSIDLTSHGAKATGITAVAALSYLYLNGGRARLGGVLTFIKHAWPKDKDAIRGQMLRGLGAFLGTYKTVDIIPVAIKLRLTSPAAILQDAALLAGHYRGRVSTHIALRILEEFNKGKRTNRLPNLFQTGAATVEEFETTDAF